MYPGINDFDGRNIFNDTKPLRRKKWSPVDRMLMEKQKKHSVGAVGQLPHCIKTSEDQSTQTHRIACTEGPCVKEREKLSLECHEAKRQIDRQKRLQSKERAKATPKAQGPCVVDASVGSSEPLGDALEQAQEQIRLLQEENANLSHTLEEKMKGYASTRNTEVQLRQDVATLQNLVAQEKEKKTGAKKRATELEKQFNQKMEEKDRMMKRLESGQDDLMQRLATLQLNLVKKAPTESSGSSLLAPFQCIVPSMRSRKATQQIDQALI